MKKRWIIMGVAGILFLGVLLGVSSQFAMRDERAEIGVLMHSGASRLSEVSSEYVDFLDSILDGNIKKLEISDNQETLNAAEQFCAEGGDVLISWDAKNLPEILQICEENQVFLLQIWEMSADTDIRERALKHKYFLGYLLSDEMEAGEKMAQSLREDGCEEISILTFHPEEENSSIQQRRKISFQAALEPANPQINLEVYSFSEGIRYLARLNREIDGLLLSERIMEYSAQTASEILGNEKMKFAYFDVNDYTREDLEAGVVTMAACGQQNILELAVAYADAFVKNGKNPGEKLQIMCPYLYLTSGEEFDRYQRLCVEKPAYSEEMVLELIDSLADGTDRLEEYAQNYSLSWLESQGRDGGEQG